MKFEEIVNKYIDYISIKGKPQSIRSIKSRIKMYILPYFKKYNINEINYDIYINWQLEINKMNFKYSYKKSLHFTNVSIFNYAIKFYDLNFNIASKVGNFNNSYELIKNINVWTYNEFKKFINVVDNIEYKTLFNFMYFTGCRLGECLALNFDDLSNNTIFINKTISKEYINGKRQITTPKTKKSIRTILIDDKLKNELNNLHEYYKKNNFKNQEIIYIFGGISPLSPSTIERNKNKYCKIANIKQIRLHDFRHSHATLLINNGVPINIISERLGHSNTNTTLNIYVHFTNEDEKKVLNTINTLRLN